MAGWYWWSAGDRTETVIISGQHECTGVPDSYAVKDSATELRNCSLRMGLRMAGTSSSSATDLRSFQFSMRPPPDITIIDCDGLALRISPMVFDAIHLGHQNVGDDEIRSLFMA